MKIVNVSILASFDGRLSIDSKVYFFGRLKMILKTIAILAVGLCMTGNAWSGGSNAIGKNCHSKYKSAAACGRDSKCQWNSGSDMCLARCSPLASTQAKCDDESKSCSYFRGQCATVL